MFPFDFLKVDKAFVGGITSESQKPGLVDQIVSLGKTCGATLIAEGIEHPDQVPYLQALGVEFGQGFLFARPLPIHEFKEWLGKYADGGSVGTGIQKGSA